MKKISSSAFIRYIVVVAALMISLNALADDPPPDLGEDPGAPIDGGVSLLIAAGVSYGAKKVYDMRKKREEGSRKL